MNYRLISLKRHLFFLIVPLACGLLGMLFLQHTLLWGQEDHRNFLPVVNLPPADRSNILISDEQFVSNEPRSQDDIEHTLLIHGIDPSILAIEIPELGTQSVASALAYLGELYTVSPSVLLTILEMNGRFSAYQIENSQKSRDIFSTQYESQTISDFILSASVILSEGFYHYYNGAIPTGITLHDGTYLSITTDNASTYALKYYFAHTISNQKEWEALSPKWEYKFRESYQAWFGNPLKGKINASHPPIIRAAGDTYYSGLPELKLPWLVADIWHYTGGPHNFDTTGNYPLSGIDFQPVGVSGCNPNVISDRWITASSNGITVDYQDNWLKLDHDGDRNVSTGWLTVYGHIANRVGNNISVAQGQRLGNPSCLGGSASGVHLHFGIKYENVWQPIHGTYISGWQVKAGTRAYHGYLERTGEVKESCFRADGSFNCTSSKLTSDNSYEEQSPPTPPTYTPVPTGQAKLYNQANFGGSVVWSGNAGFNNDPNANSYSLELPSGWSAKTWRGDNRSGEERCWSGSINNLQDHGWQNAIQSIEIFTSNACPTVTPTFTPTNTPRPPTPTATPIPQSCTNPPPDRNVAYLFENENCVNPWNWSSGHPSDGANRNAKSAWMPSGKVLLLSERNDGGEPRICLSSPVRNLADIGWGNRVEWAEMRDGCPVVQPTATPAGPKHEAKFYEEPNFANQVFTLNNPGTYRYSDLGYVDQFRKFYSVDLCSGCSIQLTNKRGDSICWGWDENNIGDHGDWPLVTVQIKFSYQNECPPREPSLQSPEEGAQFWEGDSVYVVWKDNDDPTSMYFTTEVRYGGTTIAQKYRTTERSLTVTNLAPGSYTIQSQSCSDLMCSSWKTRSFQVRVNPTATPTWTPTATDTATTRPTTTPTFTATPSPQPITTATATVTFPTRSAIPSVISPQSELVVGIGEAVTFRWQPLSYPVEYLIYVNRNGVRIADSGGLRSNTWAYTFTTPGTYEWTISSLCLGCTEYFSGFSQTYLVYAGGAPTATPTEIPAPSPTSTATPTREPDCSISIEQGALFTGQPTVRIHAAVPNAVEVQFSNDGGFTGAFWQPYANELTWTLSDPGQKIVTLLVYARFRDTAGRPLCGSTPLSDDIIYDPLPPTVRIESFTPPAYANAATESASTPGLLTVFAEDQVGGSGVTAMRVGYQADLSTLPWVPFTAVTQVTELAGKTIFVEVHDAVGNQSATASWPVNSGSLLYLPLIKR